ncbi:uncharacterized protein isoform X2 [Takifugu rubripes]|uniref:uncharacterized protein isoform X2 n=1 Tax=Takifugu rubripes TaxID=31033 RepID=UPI0011455371|nr:uncharacterized protein LOC115248308 isoform X2 [Takifugu rubripes]
MTVIFIKHTNIIKKDLMEKGFLSLNGFKDSRFSSFGRQLKLYGFKRSRPFNGDKPNILQYFHPHFQRRRPELLPLLRRCDQKCGFGMKNFSKNHLTERWRDHRNLYDTDDSIDVNLNNVPSEVPGSSNSVGSPFEPIMPQSSLPQSDFGQHKGSSLITGFVPCHDSNQMGSPMEIDQIEDQNSTEVAELHLPSARVFQTSFVDYPF